MLSLLKEIVFNMEIVLMYVKVFIVGGAICTIAQLLINYTKITAGKILVSFLLATKFNLFFFKFFSKIDEVFTNDDRFAFHINVCFYGLFNR